jgi:hypothetical protein
METLIELVQGSVKNQEAVFNALVIEDINFLLRSAKYRKTPAFKASLCYLPIDRKLTLFLVIGGTREAILCCAYSIYA